MRTTGKHKTTASSRRTKPIIGSPLVMLRTAHSLCDILFPEKTKSRLMPTKEKRTPRSIRSERPVSPGNLAGFPKIGLGSPQEALEPREGVWAPSRA